MGNGQFVTRLHSVPPLLLVDYALSTFGADLVSKALLVTGKRGVAMLFFL